MQPTRSKSWLPYVVPMGIYMTFLLVQSNANLLWVYPAKTIAVAAALAYFRKQYEELRSPMWCSGASFDGLRTASAKRRDDTTACGCVDGNNSTRLEDSAPQKRSYKDAASGDAAHNGEESMAAAKMAALQSWMFAILIGLVAIVIWIGIDPFYHKLGNAAPFDPTTIQSLAQRNLFIVVRVIGAVMVVPVMEELFWRAFLIRWLVNEDFKSVAVGTFTWASFGITMTLFGAEHSQWLAGLICGALYNWLYYKRKDVFACVVAHAVSNAALAAWVLAHGDWKFW
jgi:CAAX prenyl protease-like protein